MTTTVVAVESRLNVVSTDQEVSWVQVGIQGPAGPAGAGGGDHGALTGLTDDDHPQHPLSAGRAGGQAISGGVAASETLTLQSTAHATKGKILLGVDTAYDEVNDWLGIGTAAPVARLTSYLTAANIAPTVGPELLSSSGWTTTGWTGDFATGFTHTPGNTSVLSYPSFTAASTLEYFYRLKYTITGRTAGSVTITVGSVAKDLVTTTGVLSFDTNSTLLKPVTFTPTSDFDGTISALQLSLVTKSEALWATLDAAGKTDFEFRFSHFNSFMQMMGRNAGSFYTITTGAVRNCGFGKEAFYHLVEGISNSAFGGSDLFALAKGNYNSAFGSYVANSLRQGDNNTFCGAFANRYLKYGSGNTYLGASPVALATLTLANDMTWIGASSGTNALQGNDLSNSTAIGANSYTTTSNQIVLGNSAITEVRTSGKFYSAGAELTDSTLPLRLGYDADTYVSFAVDAVGGLTVSGTEIVLPDLVRIGASDPGAALSVSSVDQALPQVEIRNAAKFDYVLTFLAAGSVWADITAAMSLTKGAVSADLLDVVGDFIYVGLDTPFSAITLDIGTARSATASSSFEYSTGTGGWAALTVTDGTVNLTVAGTITFTPPGNWTSDVVNGSASVLWVRIGTVSGTFSAEPTAYTIVPGAIRDVVRVLANALDTIPALEVDNLGGVKAGRVGSTTVLNEAITCAANAVSGIGTLIADTSASIVKSPMGQVSSDGVMITCTSSPTALRPHNQSPRLRYTGTFWDFQSAAMVSHSFKTECVGEIGSVSTPTRTRLVTGHIAGATTGNFSEVMTLSSDGVLEVLGTGLGAEVFSNGTFDGATGWTVTGDWSYTTADFTFIYSSGAGTLKQASASYATPLKPNTWYKFSYTCGVSAPATTTAWIGTEVANYPTYFTLSTTGYPVYFKTNSAPTDFTIYATATATSGFRLDDVSLKEIVGGDIIAHGLLQSRGGLLLRPPASVTPTENGDLMVEATSNTALTFKFKGSDGTVRSGSITLS